MAGFDWVALANAAVPVVTALVAVVGVGRGPGRTRAALKHDVEILEKLPAGAAREEMLEIVTAKVHRVAELEAGAATRDLPIVWYSIVGAPAFGWLTIWLLQQREWWSLALALVSGFAAFAFIWGLFDSIQRVPRDEYGVRMDGWDVRREARLRRAGDSRRRARDDRRRVRDDRRRQQRAADAAPGDIGVKGEG